MNKRKTNLRNRLPRASADKIQDNIAQDIFLNNVDKTVYDQLNLKKSTLEELAQKYHAFESRTQLIKGMILLEGKERFSSIPPGSTKRTYNNQAFGAWIRENDLDVGSSQARHNFMNLAGFFRTRQMEGIVLSAAYELARPKYAEVAVEVYNYVKNKNYQHQVVAGMLEQKYQERKRKKPVTLTIIEEPQLGIFQTTEIEEAVYTDVVEEPINLGILARELSKNNPLEIIKAAKDFKEAAKPTTIREEEFVDSKGVVRFDIHEDEPEEVDPTAKLKFELTEAEKIEKVKELVEILSAGKMEAFKISKAVSDYFLNIRYK